jgi:hypothetical protein
VRKLSDSGSIRALQLPRLPHDLPQSRKYRLTLPSSGVAVGSSIGHAIGGFFGGSSEPAPAPQAQAAPAQQDNNQWNATGNCQGAATQFTQCMDEHGGNMQICNWYLEQLKACQAAAKNF